MFEMTNEEFEKYSPLVRGIIYRISVRFTSLNIDRFELESEAWQAYIRVRERRSLQDPGFPGYLSRSIYNAVFSVFERDKKHSIFKSLEAVSTRIYDIADEDEEWYKHRTVRISAVRRAFSSLSEDEKDIASVLWGGQKYGDAKKKAEERGETLANYNKKLHRIKRLLRENIIREMKKENEAQR